MKTNSNVTFFRRSPKQLGMVPVCGVIDPRGIETHRHIYSKNLKEAIIKHSGGRVHVMSKEVVMTKDIISSTGVKTHDVLFTLSEGEIHYHVYDVSKNVVTEGSVTLGLFVKILLDYEMPFTVYAYKG